MRIAFAVIALLAARFLAAAWFYPGQDGDLAWQQWLGQQVLHAHQLPTHLGSETFSAPGARWVPQEWAFSTAVAWAMRTAHFSLLAIAVTAMAVLSLLITAWRSHRRGASSFAVAVTTACAGFAMLDAFGVRAQIAAWLMLSLLLLLLDLENAWIFLAIPLVALWANLHASALVAPVLVGAWSVGTWIEDRGWTPRVERNLVLTVGTCFAVFMTPLLWQLPAYAVHLQTSAIRSAITEWQPSDILYASFNLGVLPLIGLCAYFGIAAPRERWRDGMLFAAASVLAFIAIRHMPLAVLIVAPMAAQRLTAAVPEHSRLCAVLHERWSEALMFAMTAAAAMLILVNLTHAPAIAGVRLPRAPLAKISAIPGEHNVFCEDFAWCSLALEKPNLRTFLDGRCDPFPDSVWQDYLTVSHLSPKWRRVLDRYRVDAVLARRGSALSQALALRSDWRPFYRSGPYEVFLRGGERTGER